MGFLGIFVHIIFTAIAGFHWDNLTLIGNNRIFKVFNLSKYTRVSCD